MNEPTKRFSDRVADYIKYRPSYPAEIIHFLEQNVHLNAASVIADVGAGTGISTSLFIDKANTVYAVEPNKEMRDAAALRFAGKKNYISIDATAEHTTLGDTSIDIIFSAQAFHWFQQQEAKKEFERILKKDGHIVLVWNIRSEESAFQKGYEAMLRTLPDFNAVSQRNVTDEMISDFFAPKKMYTTVMNNHQSFDIDGVKGRLLSSSYFPKEGIMHNKLMQETETLFNQYNQNGLIRFDYTTKIYYT